MTKKQIQLSTLVVVIVMIFPVVRAVTSFIFILQERGIFRRKGESYFYKDYLYFLHEISGIVGPDLPYLSDYELPSLMIEILYLPFIIPILYLSYKWGMKQYKKLNLSDSDLEYFKKLLFYQCAILIIVKYVRLPTPLEEIYLLPFNVAFTIIPIFILLRILASKKSNLSFADILSIKTQDDLNRNVEQILNSNNFLTALRSTLPSGAYDSKHGIDYIPYMLDNIQVRKNRFTARAKGFLYSMVMAGVIFVCISLWFGIVIINEDSIGSGREIKELNVKVRDLQSLAPYLSDKLYQTSEEYNIILNDISMIKELEWKCIKLEKLNDVTTIFDDFYKNKNIQMLRDNVIAFQNEISKPEVINTTNCSGKKINPEEYENKLKKLLNSINKFASSRESAVNNYDGVTSNLALLVEAANKELNNPNNRTSELLKRLFITVALLSFFIAILRFLASQYRSSIQQLIRAEQDDLYIRKFYIALRIAGDNDDAKKIVLTNILLNTDNTCEGKNEDVPVNLFVKEFIEALSKKI